MAHKSYHLLRKALQGEVFGSGYTLPRCLPPEGAYNWTPPAPSLVETLTPPGEAELLLEIVNSDSLDRSSGINSQDAISGDDDTETES
ncbi:hypothetical protein B9Z19DRAFT_1124193 [Tuber borchii]|uniref:Uncharacterized protein n=1 Tax=Tuber borchii TaxID=42251 RepID=A0A2T6ZX06_TUBBO|nr:hypothetical protein B9Z19DRAFT_1124193 [Tuber borchii]